MANLSLLTDSLTNRADRLKDRARCAFSGHPIAAVLALSDGMLVPGVRIESASYSLTIPALVNAFTTAVALGRMDVAGGAMSRSLRPEEKVYLESLGLGELTFSGEKGFWVDASADKLAEAINHADGQNGESPYLSPFWEGSAPSTPADGIQLAREVANRAHVPNSDFPVGCIIQLPDDRLLPGVNVENSDWSRILCAERNALGTLISYDLPEPNALFLSCPKDHGGSPCGACRQLLAELTPKVPLWMDRGARKPQRTNPEKLLPGSFSGNALLQSIL